MNSLTLRGVAEELRSLRGRRFEAAEALDPRTVRLRLDDGPPVWISVEPRHPAIFLGSAAEAATASLPIPFTRLAGSALEGSRLGEIRQAGLDRVLALEFLTRDRLGDVRSRHLVVELIGSAADLVLVEGPDPWTGRVLGRLRSLSGNPGARTGGVPYALPASGKVDVSEADDADLVASVARALEVHGPGPKALVQAWQGVSPSAAREILHRARDSRVLGDLVAAWRDLAEATRPAGGGNLTPGVFRPTLVTRQDGTPEVECYLPHGDDYRDHVSYPTLSAALAEAHRRHRAEDLARGRPAPLRALLTTLDRTERGLAALDREEAETGSADLLRRTGEALLARVHAVPRGISEAEIEDPRSGELLRVRLNPRLSAAENAELYFKKARKAERRMPALLGRRAELRRQEAALQDLRKRLEESETPEPDPEWLREAEALGVRLPRDEATAPARSDPESRLPASLRPRRYALEGGWTALVGKSNRGNDVLTLEIARPDDYWMHAHQAAGSHLVLRHDEKGKEPPRPVLLAAASLAAYFSKARGSSKVPVLISQKRHVRKPRKSPVGTVSVSRYETVMVEPRNPDEEERR